MISVKETWLKGKINTYSSRFLGTNRSSSTLGGGDRTGSKRRVPWGGGEFVEYDRWRASLSATRLGLAVYSADEKRPTIGEAFAGKGFLRTGEGAGLDDVCER